MQNQPGLTPRKPARAEATHDRQAAGNVDDAFKGGEAAHNEITKQRLRDPWRPAAGRLFDRPGSGR